VRANKEGEPSCNQSRRAILLLASIAVCFILSPGVAAQSQSAETQRLIKVAVKPEYSALAKRLNLSGVVRVEVQVQPDGKVKRAHVVGGNPVLAVDAEKAAMLTEFEPAAKESTQIIEFHFDPAS
jgi:TonB family protein